MEQSNQISRNLAPDAEKDKRGKLRSHTTEPWVMQMVRKQFVRQSDLWRFCLWLGIKLGMWFSTCLHFSAGLDASLTIPQRDRLFGILPSRLAMLSSSFKL